MTETTTKLHILQVIPALISGGAEKGTVEIAQALQKKGIANCVASAGGPMSKKLEAFGVAHHTMPLATKNPLRIIKNAFAIARLLKEKHITLMHVRSRAPAWSVLIASRLTGVPYISTFHGLYGHQSSAKRLYNSAMLRGKATIAVSGFIAEHISSVYPNSKPAIVINRGVDTDFFKVAQKHYSKSGTRHILFPARFTRLKGHVLLLEALALIKEQHFSVHFVGSSKGHEDYRQQLETVAKQLSHEVAFTEHQNDMHSLYQEADIVVSASLKPEAFGRTMIEAQAMGCMVVAPDQGANREIIADCLHNGLFVSGSAESLAEALCRISALSEARTQEIAHKARSHVIEHFEQSQMTKKTLELYEQLWQD